ncbi:MAG: T9SS type A sorting domain-containing protein, partial [Bacteroidota bacterium]
YNTQIGITSFPEVPPFLAQNVLNQDPAANVIISAAAPCFTDADDAFLALPVELLSLTGTPEGKQVRLNWSTATETNNDRFDVERSRDGQTFTKIGEVAGAGNASAIRDYTFLDPAPFDGDNYYRLRQVDLDGTNELSNVIIVDFAAEGAASAVVFPNPTTDRFSVGLRGKWQTANLQAELYDAAGRLIERWQPRATTFTHDVTALSAGVYQLRIGDGVSQSYERVLVR